MGDSSPVRKQEEASRKPSRERILELCVTRECIFSLALLFTSL